MSVKQIYILQQLTDFTLAPRWGEINKIQKIDRFDSIIGFNFQVNKGMMPFWEGIALLDGMFKRVLEEWNGDLNTLSIILNRECRKKKKYLGLAHSSKLSPRRCSNCPLHSTYSILHLGPQMEDCPKLTLWHWELVDWR